MAEEGSETLGNGSQSSQEGEHHNLEAASTVDVDLKGLLSFVARNLVTKPDEVEVTENNRDDSVVLELRVSKDDLGRVIGKQGRTAKSIRTIVNAAASRANRKVIVEIVED